MSKHTPGTWRTSDCGEWSASYDGLGSSCYQGVKDEFGNVVALAVAHNSELFSEPDTEANARLIAAAPDLLAVCQELEQSASYWSEYDVPLGIVDRIKSAIDKATGEA